MLEHVRSGEKVFRGIAVSPGICQGKVFVVGKREEAIPQSTVTDEEVGHHVDRLEQALFQTRQQILDIQRQVTQAMGAADANIFEAHLLVLEDRVLIDEVIRLIREEKVNAESAFHTVASRYIATLSAVDDEYLRERVADMRDVIARILNNLMGRQEESTLRSLNESCVVISHDLSPSTTAMLDKKMVLGFATDVGSKTSHTAIMRCCGSLMSVES